MKQRNSIFHRFVRPVISSILVITIYLLFFPFEVSAAMETNTRSEVAGGEEAFSEEETENSEVVAGEGEMLSVTDTDEEDAGPEGSQYCVVIDSGHGGEDPGALDATGTIHEAEINQEVTNELVQLLKADSRVRVVETHQPDENPGINERAAMGWENNADLLLSLHLNSGGDNHDVRGFMLFPPNPWSPYHEESTAAATIISEQMIDAGALPYEHDGIFYLCFYEGENMAFYPAAQHQDGTLPIYGPTFGVVEYAETPALLIEQWFITNDDDMKQFNNAAGIRKMADALYKGTINYLTTVVTK